MLAAVHALLAFSKQSFLDTAKGTRSRNFSSMNRGLVRWTTQDDGEIELAIVRK